jgi:hypothetical protein
MGLNSRSAEFLIFKTTVEALRSSQGQTEIAAFKKGRKSIIFCVCVLLDLSLIKLAHV